ncbi:hypothetical protein SAMN05421493_11810 [Pseudobutyrivibrio sp. 49]|uniref:hypothetical protein n=1 Tax=Pseudobutyrivibrio sp. 49 TaxID=1855344 RepID=UPI000883C0B1|nr:hypothetical protein [Pseudobutyrivibrio sp. 49]SDI55900.1 hypothetical protein SAMN05421493_11810 [Pseudobutyrivibrio sp. 49]
MGCHYDEFFIRKDIFCPYCGIHSFKDGVAIVRITDSQYELFDNYNFIGLENETGFIHAYQWCPNCKAMVDLSIVMRDGKYIDIVLHGTELDVDIDSIPAPSPAPTTPRFNKRTSKTITDLFQAQEIAVQNHTYIDFASIEDLAWGYLVNSPIENGAILFTSILTQWRDDTGAKCRLYFAAEYNAESNSVQYIPRRLVRDADGVELNPIAIVTEANRAYN